MHVETKSLSCQKCGGVLKCADNHNAYRCEYCHSVSVISEIPLLVDGIQPINDTNNIEDRHPIALLADFLF